MATVLLHPRFAAFARWLSARPEPDAPSPPALATWLSGPSPLALAIGTPRGARAALLHHSLTVLEDVRVLLVPIEVAWDTALEGQYLPALHDLLADQAGEAPQRVLHPTALRDRVAELLQFVEVEHPGRTLLVIDGLDAALDGDPAGWLGAFLDGARAQGDAAPLRLLLAAASAEGLLTALGDVPVISLDVPADEPSAADERALHDVRRATLSAAVDAWRASRRTGEPPEARILPHVRPALLDAWRAGAAEDIDAAAILSLLDPAWLACRRQAPDGVAGFLADACAIRQRVATTRHVADEIRCALIEASVLDAETRAARPPAEYDDGPERARALTALAASASAEAREALLSWARTALGTSSDEEAAADLAAAARGERPDASEPWTARPLLAEIDALPPEQRVARADQAIDDAMLLPDNLAIGTVTELAARASALKRAQALSALAARYLALPPSHAEIGFDLARRPDGMAEDLARRVFSRILDHLLHGKLPFRRAWLLCSTEGDLRMLAPLIALIGGDEALFATGRAIVDVAQAFT